MDFEVKKQLEELNEELLVEMARIGYAGDLEVYVMTDDPGYVPHMHLRDKMTRGQQFHSRVCLTKAEYAPEEGKKDLLNTHQKKDLVHFLKQPHRKKGEMTNWQYLLTAWNDNNSKVTVDEDQPMPDYMKL